MRSRMLRRLAAVAFTALAVAQEEPVIRITVGLVQVDAVVTDRSGRFVPGLTKDDFELLQDGKPKRITKFAYVATDAPPRSGAAALSTPGFTPSPSPAPSRAEVRRTIAILIDDLGLSFRSMGDVRDGLKRFLREQTSPGDLIAILRTTQTSGAYQNFTTDRAQLLAAVDALRWDFRSRVADSPFAALTGQGLVGRTDSETEGQRRAREADAQAAQLREDYFAVGTIGAVQYVVRGLREMPGRKCVVVVSEGFTLRGQPIDRTGSRRPDDSASVPDATGAAGPLRSLAEAAARAGVVIYSLDPRGIAHTGVTAADHVRSGIDLTAVSRQRADLLLATREPLQYLANETGGLFFGDLNGVDRLLSRVMEDQAGYYLLGYDPGDAAFNRAFHGIEVKVKKRGLRVRGRSGYFGVEDAAPAAPERLAPGPALVRAMQSPFRSSEIPVRLTGMFAIDSTAGPVVNCLLHIDARALRLARGEDGVERGALDVLIAGFGRDGTAPDHSAHSYTVEVKPEDGARVREEGLTYHVKYPVKKPGPYQIRAAAMERESRRAGTASRFLVTPDTARGQFALSGIILDDKNAGVTTGYASRTFRPGGELQWGLQALNPATDAATGRPALSLRMRLHKDGKVVYDGTPTAVQAPQPTGSMAFVTNSLRLSTSMRAGEYVLELELTDQARKKPITVSAWIDFRVAP